MVDTYYRITLEFFDGQKLVETYSTYRQAIIMANRRSQLVGPDGVGAIRLVVEEIERRRFPRRVVERVRARRLHIDSMALDVDSSRWEWYRLEQLAERFAEDGGWFAE